MANAEPYFFAGCAGFAPSPGFAAATGSASVVPGSELSGLPDLGGGLVEASDSGLISSILFSRI